MPPDTPLRFQPPPVSPLLACRLNPDLLEALVCHVVERQVQGGPTALLQVRHGCKTRHRSRAPLSTQPMQPPLPAGGAITAVLGHGVHGSDPGARLSWGCRAGRAPRRASCRLPTGTRARAPSCCSCPAPPRLTSWWGWARGGGKGEGARCACPAATGGAAGGRICSPMACAGCSFHTRVSQSAPISLPPACPVVCAGAAAQGQLQAGGCSRRRPAAGAAPARLAPGSSPVARV